VRIGGTKELEMRMEGEGGGGERGYIVDTKVPPS
jgi:hypothetical protein